MVGAIGLGCMSFAGFFGEADDDKSLECLDAALKAGIDFWDTANVYGMGKSESIIGQYLAGSDASPVIATKATIVPGPPRRFDNSADHLRSELEASLKRLGRDKVELFYIHRREQERPLEEVIETLAGFIDEGLIDGYGMSEVAPDTIRRAHAVHPCRAVQNEYSLWTRLPELGVIQTCGALGIAFVPFSPVARGFFSQDPITPASMGRGRLPRPDPALPGAEPLPQPGHADPVPRLLRREGLDRLGRRHRLDPRPGAASPADPRHPDRRAPRRMGRGRPDHLHR